jgi:hypothetical protein
MLCARNRAIFETMAGRTRIGGIPANPALACGEAHVLYLSPCPRPALLRQIHATQMRTVRLPNAVGRHARCC